MSPAAGHGDGVANHKVVFVDTSLDTHLALIVTESDTVSDFKRKIMLEHRMLFPAIGDIKVERLKVKRRENFYHLSDSMLVKSAFGAAKRNLFVSVDASSLEQNDGIQQRGKHKDGDQLALPGVTHNHSIERHDNHESPSIHSKTVRFVNQKVLSIDQPTSGDSYKDVLKNVEKDTNDNQLDYELQDKLYTVNTDISSRKRTCNVHDGSSLKDAFESGPSVKKKHKTQRLKSNVKASEGNPALTYDNDKINNKDASINNENSFEHKSKGKESSDENNRTYKDEICSALDQEATVVPSTEGVGSETVGDVAVVVETNIQKEMSIGMPQKEKDSELIRKQDMENEIPSLTRVNASGHSKRSTKHKAAGKEVYSTALIKKLHNTDKDATVSSQQQDVGSNGQECAGDRIDKYKDNSEITLKQRPELKLPERKQGIMGCESIGEGKRRKTKKLFKHPDNLVGDISSTTPAPIIDERKMNEDSDKTVIDANKGDDVNVEEREISIENTDEKSRKEFTGTNDVVTVTNEDNFLLHSESLMNNDTEISNAQGVLDKLEKQNEKTDDTTKRKRKTKKTARGNEDESITKHLDRDICENVKEGEGGLLDADNKDGDVSSTVIDEKMNNVAEETLIDAKKCDGAIVKGMEISVENMEKKSLKEFTDTNAEISATGKNTGQVNAQGILDNLEKQNEKSGDATKKKKKRKTKKSTGLNEDESIPKVVDGGICENVKEGESSLLDTDRKDGNEAKERDSQICYEGLVGEANKNIESQNLPSKHLSTVELVSKKSRSVGHHHLPEKTLKNMAASEVSQVNNEVDIPEDGSHDFDMDYFAPGHQPKKAASIGNSKDMKKTKDDLRNDRSQKLISKNVNNKVSVNVLTDPNITNSDNLKTPKRTKKIDVQKTNSQQSISGQIQVKSLKNKSVNSARQAKSLLNTPGTIFGDDNASVDSDSSKGTSSTKLSSPSSSSSGESAFSIGARRNRSLARRGQEDEGKNNLKSQTKSKNPLMNDLLRRSSRFKKAKVNASSQVQDTESQPVDFVPESQPMDK